MDDLELRVPFLEVRSSIPVMRAPVGEDAGVEIVDPVRGCVDPSGAGWIGVEDGPCVEIEDPVRGFVDPSGAPPGGEGAEGATDGGGVSRCRGRRGSGAGAS